LPEELTKEYDIRIVPIGLVINGTPYRDQVDITSNEFWKIFKDIKRFSTSTLGPGEFVSVFTQLAQSTDSIVCIVVSKALSAVHESAVQAKEIVRPEHPELNIEIVDSKTAAGAEGFIVLEAARSAQAGNSLAEVTRVARDMIPRVKFFTALETLKYLIKSGRAPKTAVIGELLQVKPIIGMVSGTGLVENLGRARGKRKAVARMVDMVKDYIDASKPLHFMVHYTDRIEDGDELRGMVTSQFNCTEVYLTPYTPVMGGSTGPVVSLSFYA
jgi:DegV family protein with EDD domain